MNVKPTTARTRKSDVPYDPKDKAATQKYWEEATAHQGVGELRAKRGRPAKPPEEGKEQIALRVDKDVLEWYRAQGAGWQTRMNAVLKAFRDAAG
ncbi:MAG: BrnA antitoxin family protein [Nitrococcus sp.]|nr:BrnA antitoxin family protein [Nitrococcus sp.]